MSDLRRRLADEVQIRTGASPAAAADLAACLELVVGDFADQRAAEELLAAVDAEPGNYGPRLRRRIRDRAASLVERSRVPA